MVLQAMFNAAKECTDGREIEEGTIQAAIKLAEHFNQQKICLIGTIQTTEGQVYHTKNYLIVLFYLVACWSRYYYWLVLSKTARIWTRWADDLSCLSLDWIWRRLHPETKQLQSRKNNHELIWFIPRIRITPCSYRSTKYIIYYWCGKGSFPIVKLTIFSSLS